MTSIRKARPRSWGIVRLDMAFWLLLLLWLGTMANADVEGNLRGSVVNPGFGPAPSGPVGRLRLATYNIHWGLGADGVQSLERTAAVLREMDADIVVLNEVDVNWRRSGNVDQAAYLAAAAGYPYTYYSPALRTWASGGLRLSLYGNALLSRFPVQDARTVRLPTAPGREPRAVLVARVLVGGEPLTVLGTHLGLNQGERLWQTARLKELAAAEDGPVVLLGDFNAHPWSPELRQLTDGPAGLVDAHAVAGSGDGLTFPAHLPLARIDYAFVSQNLAPRVLAVRPWTAGASDHLPVVVDLAWPGLDPARPHPASGGLEPGP
ncbi:MAG TPA: endonuclease/exonuclease/phosphatase family protein [Limnochordales bacterium]